MSLLDWCAKLYEHGAGNKFVSGWEKIVGQGITNLIGTKYDDQASSVKVNSNCTLLLYEDKIDNLTLPVATLTEDLNFKNNGPGNYNDAISLVDCSC